MTALARPADNKEVSSLVVYYEMLQVKDAIQEQYRTVPNRSHEENLKKILSLLENNDTMIIGFKNDVIKFMHQVLAYGSETGSFTKNGTTYDRRILVCDPNHCNSFSDDHCIYFNSRTYAWEIPAYAQSGISSANGAAFNFISADVNVINAGGYLSSDSGKGDVNGDGAVNMKDLVLLQRYLNQWAVNINLSACDINGDGSVNMKDYVALQRKLNGWTV